MDPASAMSTSLLAGIAIALVAGLVGFVVVIWWVWNHAYDALVRRRTGALRRSVLEASDMAMSKQNQIGREKTNKVLYRMAGENGAVTVVDDSYDGKAKLSPSGLPMSHNNESSSQGGWFQRLMPIPTFKSKRNSVGASTSRDSILPPPRPAYNEMSMAALQRYGLDVSSKRGPRGNQTTDFPSRQIDNDLDIITSTDIEAAHHRSDSPMVGHSSSTAPAYPPFRVTSTVTVPSPALTSQPIEPTGAAFHSRGVFDRTPTIASDVDTVRSISSPLQASHLPLSPSAAAKDRARMPASSSSPLPRGDKPSIVFLSRESVMNQSSAPMVTLTPALPPSAAMTALLIAEAQARLEAETIATSFDESRRSWALSEGSPVTSFLGHTQLEAMTEKSTVSSAAWSWAPSARGVLVPNPASAAPASDSRKDERRVVVSPMERRRQRERQEQQQQKATHASGAPQQPPRNDSASADGLIGIAIAFYTPQTPTEVDLYPGNSVVIFEAYDDGMGFGVNRTTMIGGLIPLKLITFATSEEFPDGIFVPVKLTDVSNWRERRPLLKNA
ncbi:hypothetical protein HDU67_001802 [Dinochytrium kinnereticum]|nr:hypothetical protein HDU67_001802 [Dinochytrium kinnereticum]